MLDGDPHKRTRDILMGLLMSVARTILNTAVILAITLSVTQTAFATTSGAEEAGDLPTRASTRLTTTTPEPDVAPDNPLTRLPTETLLHICYLLPQQKDVLNLSLASKHLRWAITSLVPVDLTRPTSQIVSDFAFAFAPCPFKCARGSIYLIDRLPQEENRARLLDSMLALLDGCPNLSISLLSPDMAALSALDYLRDKKGSALEELQNRLTITPCDLMSAFLWDRAHAYADANGIPTDGWRPDRGNNAYYLAQCRNNFQSPLFDLPGLSYKDRKVWTILIQYIHGCVGEHEYAALTAAELPEFVALAQSFMFHPNERKAFLSLVGHGYDMNILHVLKNESPEDSRSTLRHLATVIKPTQHIRAIINLLYSLKTDESKRLALRLCGEHSILQKCKNIAHVSEAIDILSTKPEAEREAWAKRLFLALDSCGENPVLISFKLHQAKIDSPNLEETYVLSRDLEWDPGNIKQNLEHMLSFINFQISDACEQQELLAEFLSIPCLEPALAKCKTANNFDFLFIAGLGNERQRAALELCHEHSLLQLCSDPIELRPIINFLSRKPESEVEEWARRLYSALEPCHENCLEFWYRLFLAKIHSPELEQPLAEHVTPWIAAAGAFFLIGILFV